MSIDTYRSPEFLALSSTPVKQNLNIYKNRKMSVQSSSAFKNQLPQMAQLVKQQNSHKNFEPSPQQKGVSGRKSEFIQKSHLSISSIYTMNSVSHEENLPESSSIKLKTSSFGNHNASEAKLQAKNTLKSEKMPSLNKTSTSKSKFVESKHSSGMVMLFNNMEHKFQ